MNLPIISIIVPVYNSEKTILRCLRSIQNQTIKNIEIIAVDDGSSDRTGEILEQEKKNDARIIYVKKENGGVSSARNRGLILARGRYIAFVDSDDYIHSQMYEQLYQKAECGFDLVISGFEIKGKNWSRTVRPTETVINEQDWRRSFPEAFDAYLWNTPWNKLFRRELIKYYFDEKKSIGEDIKFVFDYVKTLENVAYIPDALYVNDLSNENSLSKNVKRIINEEEENHIIMYDFLQKNGIEIYGKVSDYIISKYWIIISECIKQGLSYQEKKRFLTYSRTLKDIFSKTRPGRCINKMARTALISDIIIIRYIVINVIAYLSVMKSKIRG